MVGALALCAAVWGVARLDAQTTLTVTVEDSRGAALTGASVTDAANRVLGRTDAYGRLTLSCSTPCQLRVDAQGFAEKTVQLSSGATFRLEPAAIEQVTVTAYRTPLGELESPVTTRVLTQAALNSSPALALDGKLRQLPGVELYRRTSSLIANPSAQGLSLRGLGSTAASRTLLTEDDVPLNDPFAGWIHWQEQPELSIKSIELVRGGASDLYGSSAIGGVVNVVPVRPASNLVELRSGYGSENTYDDSLLLSGKRGPWGALASGGALGTDGYIQEAPSQRGPVDFPSNVHSQNGLLLIEHDRGGLRLFVRGNGFNDARDNGTPVQTNATRVWRYATGGDWQAPRNGSLVARFYGSTEHFRQIFSTISNLPKFGDPSCSYRCGDTANRLSHSPENEWGAVTHWNQPLGAGLLVVAGADTHDLRVWDREQTYGKTAALTNLSDHQRDEAAYAELMWAFKGWTATASGRIDFFQNYDGVQRTWTGSFWVPSASQPTTDDERVFDPRMGLSRKLGNHWALNASGFRAFRAPSPNELYRSTQVGNQLTLPNFGLESERATGWETGAASEWKWGTIRASYFLTQVNRPITALLTNATSSPMLFKRENLGQIESRGLAIDYELALQRWLALDGGYQYANATVTRFNQQPALVGNWIPEVPHNLASANLRAYRSAWGTLNLQARMSGRQFDDSANTYILHSFFRLDVYASHDFGKRFRVFAAGENLLDRSIEVGKTPTATLGSPRVAHAGIQVQFGGEMP
jgi:outer membrane receptor protein involved in Fe transport